MKTYPTANNEGWKRIQKTNPTANMRIKRMLRIFAQAIPDIESWPQENEARLVTRDGFGQHRGFSFAKANEYDIATLHQCIAQDKVARQSRFLEIADFLEAIPTASVQASQASPSVARVHTPSVTKRHQASPSVASVTKRVASKRRKGADTLTLRSHSGSASSTKTKEEEMETQRHRDTNCQGYRQDTDCQGIGPESVICFLFVYAYSLWGDIYIYIYIIIYIYICI